MKRALLLLAALTLVSADAYGKDSVSYKGLWLSTPFPTRTIAADAPVTLDLAIHNYNLPPQLVALGITTAPPNWHAVFLGDNRPVDSVAVAPDGSADLKVQIAPPEGVQHGSYGFVLRAQGQDGQALLPITFDIGQVLPARLALAADLPDLQGTANSTFSYKVTVRNESGQDALVDLRAQTPPNFQVTFKQAYGSKELTTVPVKAGSSEDINVDVSPPPDITAGRYSVTVAAAAGSAQASTTLKLDVTGRPELSLAGPEGLVSGRAYAGKSTPVHLVVANTGSAPARGIRLSADAPTGWKIDFQPKSIDSIAPNGKVEAVALVTPAEKAIAGDYMVTMRSDGGGALSSSRFRITVETSTLWGIVGVAIIAIALSVLGLAVVRYGRR